MWRRNGHSAQESDPTEHEMQRAMSFRRCVSCEYDFATGEGAKACNLYSCPYLPSILDVFCPTCNYDFATGEGRPECSDPPTCKFAVQEAPHRVTALHRWEEESAEAAAG